MRGKCCVRRVGRGRKPACEIPHKRRNLCRRRKAVASGFGADITRQVGVLSGNLRRGPLHDQPVKVAHVAFRQGRLMPREFAHIADGVVMIERLKMVLKRLTADRNPLFDDQRGFNRAERVAFDGVRRVREFDVVVMLQVGKRLRRQRPQLFEPLLFRGYRCQKFIHDAHQVT